VDVAVGAKKSVVVGEGVSVNAGVGVSVGVGRDSDMAVTVSLTDVSMYESVGSKFGSDLDTPRLHALSRNMAAAMKNNKKYFLIRMAPLFSIKNARIISCVSKNYSIKKAGLTAIVKPAFDHL
jgi:hypothetical protein